MAKKQKSFDAELDALLAGVELPSDEAVKFETSLKKRNNDPEYRKQYLIAQSTRKKVKEKKTDTLSVACQLRSSQESYKIVHKINSKAQMNYIRTPEGVFCGLREAAEHFNLSKPGFHRRLRVNPTEYYYITQEEYNAAKNKNVKK
jgi:hypothetical protein